MQRIWLLMLQKKLNDAKNQLANVGENFHDGCKIFHYIRKLGLGGIISIRKISFSVGLSVVSSGHFLCGVDVQFLGKDKQHFQLSINLHSLSEVANDLKDKVVSAFKNVD